jgi:hypothetical protein
MQHLRRLIDFMRRTTRSPSSLFISPPGHLPQRNRVQNELLDQPAPTSLSQMARIGKPILRSQEQCSSRLLACGVNGQELARRRRAVRRHLDQGTHEARPERTQPDYPSIAVCFMTYGLCGPFRRATVLRGGGSGGTSIRASGLSRGTRSEDSLPIAPATLAATALEGQ